MITLPNIYEDDCPHVDESWVLVLRPGLSYMMVGETIQFSTVLAEVDGETLVESQLGYASSDSSIVSIDANGLATVLAEGHVIISVITGSTIAYATIYALIAETPPT